MPSCIEVCNADDKVNAWKKQTDGILGGVEEED